jgi:hypothetical protein
MLTETFYNALGQLLMSISYYVLCLIAKGEKKGMISREGFG